MELPTVQANEYASTNSSASNSVFSNLQGRRLDRLAGWLGRELHGLFRERIYTAAGFSSRLVHDRHFDEARNDELAGFIQFLIAYSRHLLDDGLYVSLENLRSLCNCINQLILGHLGHDGFLVEAQSNLKRRSNAECVTLFKNAAKPRSSLFVHAYGHEVTGLKTYRGPKRKEQLGVCSIPAFYSVIRHAILAP